MKAIILFLLLTLTLFSAQVKDFEKEIKSFLYKKFTTYYKTLNINQISLSSNQNNLKIDNNFKIYQIILPKNALKREKGTLSVILTNKTKQKRLYFRYKIDADALVFVAAEDIEAYTPLMQSMFFTKRIKFTNFYDKPIVDLQGLESKVFIPQGKILIQRLVRKIPLVHRGDLLSAVARDGRVEVFFNVKALDDGQKGEVIKVRREYKILKAKVLSRSEVEIQ